jgi:hypothetical protein
LSLLSLFHHSPDQIDEGIRRVSHGEASNDAGVRAGWNIEGGCNITWADVGAIPELPEEPTRPVFLVHRYPILPDLATCEVRRVNIFQRRPPLSFSVPRANAVRE